MIASATMGPDTVWFWLVVGVGTAALSAVGRWSWTALREAFREWVREPVKEAQKSAQEAATHAGEVKQAIGQPNGHGDLITMVTRSLANQEQMFAWQREHDGLDAQTRADVKTIKDHLGL